MTDPAAPAYAAPPPAKTLRRVLWGLLLLGGATFLIAAYGPNRLRAWQIFLVNFLFWSGMAQGGLVFVAVYDLTRARWGEPVRTLALGMGGFLPVSFFLLFVLFAGAEILFPWARQPIPEKKMWLNLPFLFSRDAIGLLGLYSVALAYLYYSLRPRVGAELVREGGRLPWTIALLVKGWRGEEAERERSRRFLATLAPLFIVCYGLVFSLLGFDWVMALDPQFYSTLFGAYFFMSSFYLGLAGTVITAALAQKRFGLEKIIGKSQFHDLGKFLLAFCMVTGDFLWSQYAVIWYGNLPEETGFIILRTKTAPWSPLAWAVLIIGFIGPFLVLLSRRAKENPVILGAVAFFIAVGLWLERYLLVVPSLSRSPELPLGWIELFISLGFLSAFLLTYLGFGARFQKILKVLPG